MGHSWFAMHKNLLCGIQRHAQKVIVFVVGGVTPLWIMRYATFAAVRCDVLGRVLLAIEQTVDEFPFRVSKNTLSYARDETTRARPRGPLTDNT